MNAESAKKTVERYRLGGCYTTDDWNLYLKACHALGLVPKLNPTVPGMHLQAAHGQVEILQELDTAFFTEGTAEQTIIAITQRLVDQPMWENGEMYDGPCLCGDCVSYGDD